MDAPLASAPTATRPCTIRSTYPAQALVSTRSEIHNCSNNSAKKVRTITDPRCPATLRRQPQQANNRGTLHLDVCCVRERQLPAASENIICVQVCKWLKREYLQLNIDSTVYKPLLTDPKLGPVWHKTIATNN